MSKDHIETKGGAGEQSKSTPPQLPTKLKILQQRTVDTVRRFLRALGSSDYDIGVLRNGKMQRRTVSMEYLEHSDEMINFWRSANAAGSDIYVAPARAGGANADKNLYPAIILIDDLEKSAISKMRKTGYAPCAVVETSPNNYQAWVHVTSKMYDVRTLLQVSCALTKKFGGDPLSVVPGQHGRLPGFTNRKPEHARRKISGKDEHPFARLYYAFDSNRDEKRFPDNVGYILNLLAEASADMPWRQGSPVAKFIKNKDPKRPPLPRNNQTDLNAQLEVDATFKALSSYYGANYDAIRADWTVITKLLKWRFPDSSIAKALFYSAEANLLSRQTNVGYYLKLTFTNAYNELIKQGINIPPLSREFGLFIESIGDTD